MIGIPIRKESPGCFLFFEHISFTSVAGTFLPVGNGALVNFNNSLFMSTACVHQFLAYDTTGDLSVMAHVDQTEGTTGSCGTTNANFHCPPEMDLCFHLNGNYFYEIMSMSKRVY